jgi:shikimate kinase
MSLRGDGEPPTMDAMTDALPAVPADLLDRLGTRSIVFIGLMGAGKTAIGRKVAQALGLPFIDSDHEIETVSRMTIPELFEHYGEPEFRALEERVISRLVKDGPQVLSTGGGAFMNANTRAAVATDGVSVWLKADLDTLMARVVRKPNRPLLQNPDPRGVMQKLMNDRYPVYGLANIIVQTREAKREEIMAEVIASIADWLKSERPA